ncbi:hypothetical protein HCH_03160 [Hahella chejuensis KCTC 2396]|uniref:Uncharacterized protein n=1 Tax=Hahella chejuensis (strain KCTC 2396) TaxID=349521 RepID=Q2SHF1_HAHCH|nr:hypothetical protein HCH_03160 [Hahella chejuensis KCTC 2396]
MSVDLHASVCSSVRGEWRKVQEVVYLSDSLSWMDENEIHYLVKGLSIVDGDIKKSLGKDAFIYIEEIDFNECDFQPEGLSCAMAGWVREYLGLSLKEVNVEFDKQSRRYRFSINGVDL